MKSDAFERTIRAAEHAASLMRAQADLLDQLGEQSRSSRHATQLKKISDRLRVAADMLILESTAGDAVTTRLSARVARRLLTSGAALALAAASGAATASTTVLLEQTDRVVIQGQLCLDEVESAASDLAGSEHFADRVRRLVDESGLTKRQIADTAQISTTALNHILSGQTHSKLPTIHGLANALGLTVSELIDGTDAMRRERGPAPIGSRPTQT